MKGLTIMSALLGAVLFTSLASAQTGTAPTPRPAKAPSMEAAAACQGKTAGADTTIITRKGDQVVAKCRMRGAMLVGVPVPPQVAVDACKSRAEGTPTSFTIPSGRVVQGVCQTVDGTMVAVPVRDFEGGGKKGKKGNDRD